MENVRAKTLELQNAAELLPFRDGQADRYLRIIRASVYPKAECTSTSATWFSAEAEPVE